MTFHTFLRMLWVLGAIMMFGAALGVWHYFPTGSRLKPDAHGIIHHPWYGDYPAVVPYHDGMTIEPGQAAELQIEIGPDQSDGPY